MNFTLRISIWVLVISLLCAVSAWRFSEDVSLQADILSVIPNTAYPQKVTQLLDQKNNSLQRNIALLVGASSEQESTVIGNVLKKKLTPFIKFDSKPLNTNETLLMFFSSGHFLAPEQHEQLLAEQNTAFISDTYGVLTMPGNHLVEQAITTDPLFIGLNYMRYMSQTMGLNLSSTQNIKTNGLIYQSLSGTLKAGDTVDQITQINTFINKVTKQYKHQNADIIRSGFAFHSTAAEQQAKYEVSSYGLAALIGIILMVMVVFRSPLPLFLSVLGVSSSILTGLAAIACLFEEIHILTFVFAVSLVGISIDYTFHFFAHRSGPKENSSLFHKALSASLITSVLGYSLLAMAPLPLLKQVAVFMIFGLLSAYLFTRYVINAHPWRQERMSDVASWLITIYHLPFRFLIITKTRLLFLSLVLLTLSLLVLTLQSENLFKDDIRLLITPSEALFEEEKNFRQITQSQWESGFLLVTAPNEQQLLKKTHFLDQQLKAAIQNQQINAYLALTSWLPDTHQQHENQKLIHKLLASGVAQEYLSLLDYKPEATRFLYSGKQTVSLADITQQLPVSGAQQLLLNGSDNIAAIYLLQKVSDWSSVKKLTTQQPYPLLIDKPNDISSVLGEIRSSVLLLLSGILILALCYLSWMFNFKDALYAIALVALAIAVSLFSSFLWMGYLNIFNLFAALLIIALGLDYIIFYLSPLSGDRVRLAILLSSISTLLAFGLLSFSATPAVASFGSGVMSGIVALILFTPTIRFLWRSQ